MKMKSLLKITVLSIMFFAFCASCDARNDEVDKIDMEETIMVSEKSNTKRFTCRALASDTVIEETLSQKDIDNILYMLEEEKLAYNVYVFFNEKYNRRVFENISKSEIRHQEALKWLTKLYNIQVPKEKPFGEFHNAELQAMYTKLTSEATSLADALKAGALIEEHDIRDLQKAISESQNDNVKRVFSNLKRASGHHLQAFVANLRFLKIDYKPQILTQEEFDAYIAKN